MIILESRKASKNEELELFQILSFVDFVKLLLDVFAVLIWTFLLILVKFGVNIFGART
jgi:hypothetical protein